MLTLEHPEERVPNNTSTGIGATSNTNKHTDVPGIYPNPTTGMLTIEHAAAGALTITSITGSQVASYNTKAGKNNITLPAAIPSGIYLLRFTDITTGKMTNVSLLYKP